MFKTNHRIPMINNSTIRSITNHAADGETDFRIGAYRYQIKADGSVFRREQAAGRTATSDWSKVAEWVHDIGFRAIDISDTFQPMTVEELDESPDYYRHHTASYRGYVSRVHGPIVEPYRGKFGEGYVVRSPRWDTTTYAYITYYIKCD